MGLFGFGSKDKSEKDMTDRELLKEISKGPTSNGGIARFACLVKEAKKRGLKNPKTGKVFQD